MRPALLLAMVVLVACKPGDAPKTGGPGRGGPVPVLAATVLRKEMPVTVRAVGNVRPVQTVTIRPQVGGQIREVHFEEGAEVAKDALLFTIDPRPFEVAAAQAKARLAQTMANRDQALDQQKRYTGLSRTGAVATEQLEQFKTSAEALGATVDAEEAAVRAAQLQLDYCSVRSPIAGRAGRRLVDLGNVVQPNTSELVMINQITPIEVAFAVPERLVGPIRAASGERELPVSAAPSGDRARVAAGTLSFVDNAVQASTGTINLKAAFPNEEEALWPGQFVDVTLTLAVEIDAVVAPAAAIQSGQQGTYVMLIKTDSTVEPRPVRVDRMAGQEAVIAEGLKGGERVVVDGHVRLMPGAKVLVREKSAVEGGDFGATSNVQRPTSNVQRPKPESEKPERFALTLQRGTYGGPASPLDGPLGL